MMWNLVETALPDIGPQGYSKPVMIRRFIGDATPEVRLAHLFESPGGRRVWIDLLTHDQFKVQSFLEWTHVAGQDGRMTKG